MLRWLVKLWSVNGGGLQPMAATCAPSKTWSAIWISTHGTLECWTSSGKLVDQKLDVIRTVAEELLRRRRMTGEELDVLLSPLQPEPARRV